jgi:hypothetical protein
MSDIRLFQVLDDYGVGTIETIALGIVKALAYFGYATYEFREWGCEVTLTSPEHERPLIVNCSFMLTIPRGLGHTMIDIEWGEKLFQPPFLEKMRKPSEALFETLAVACASVVAAAGNDRPVPPPGHTINSPRPEARDPAAHQTVIGVGACKADLKLKQPTQYSNKADVPAYDGFVTIGGEVFFRTSDNEIVTDAQNGILGVYVGNIPPATSGGNQSNWARWAGTSFATPIITAMLGLLRRNGLGKDAAVAALRNYCTTMTADNEPIFPMGQG